MSLLWTEASHHKISMPWWNNEREFEHEGDDEYPLRDPSESLRDRGQRYKQRVMENHGVGASVAQGAIQHVVKHLEDDSASKDPTEYGFASSSRAHDHWGPEMGMRLMDPHTWKGRVPQQVDLTEPIHASQDFVRPSSVAHNLFHPGKKQPEAEDEAVGDPDYDPDDTREEDESDHGGEDHHSQVYFMRRNSGRMEVVDGHHRVATNLLLGKKKMQGVVIHENEIPLRRRR